MPLERVVSNGLRRGYTTGVHTVLAFRSALGVFLTVGGVVESRNRKMDNDDLDVTKGAEIVVTLSESLKNLTINPEPHHPYRVKNLQIFAGVGVGVVTKDGLKPPKGFPAINPTPLQAITRHYLRFGKNRPLFCSVSVVDGERIAKSTANGKVGVVGGISILGTTGWVKPVSSSSYISSIETEAIFAKKNGYNLIVFTLGNSSLNYAKERFDEEQIVEVGNFIYDSLKIAERIEFKKVLFIVGIGKATKIVQGFKNTHNRFGGIDFQKVKSLIESGVSPAPSVDVRSLKTLRAVLNYLNIDEERDFRTLINSLAKQVLESWSFGIEVDLIIV